MRIIAINSLREYWEKHPEIQQPLSEWYLKASRMEWESFDDMRTDFNDCAISLAGRKPRLMIGQE
mgnify:CR=1 FL=1